VQHNNEESFTAGFVCEHMFAVRKRKAKQTTLDSFFAKKVTTPE
jgi:hypothetical protein